MTQIESPKPVNLFQKIGSLLREIRRHERNPYIRISPDGTRDICVWRDTESEVDRVIFHHRNEQLVFRIMEICRSAHSGEVHYTLMIEAVERSRNHIVKRSGYYDENGILQWHGTSSLLYGESPEKYREYYRQHGYFDIAHVPSRIDYNETVKRFLLNAVSAEPSFETPMLVPYKAQNGIGQNSKHLHLTP